VSRHMVIRLEQSLFPSPLHSEALSDLYSVDQELLISEYYRYIKTTRLEFSSRYPPFSEVLYHYSGSTHPLIYYRERFGLSRIGLCKGLCLHNDPITNYEKNDQRGVPQQLIIACNSIEWDYGPLENAVNEWRIAGHADRPKV